MNLYPISSQPDLIRLIQQVGFLPFFANPVPGFSLEELAVPDIWFPPHGDGVWEWKGPVIRESGCAYGKFFRGKAGFISREWYPDFANYRRDGYDFDALYEDGLARSRDKQVYDLLEKHGSLLSKELKRLGNFRKNGKTGFEGIITRLQMQGYVVVSDFEYQKDKHGNIYGWGVARYETPEQRFDAEFSGQVYQRTPQESLQRIQAHLAAVLDGAELRKLQSIMQR